MMPTKVVAEKIVDCAGCQIHGPETCRVRNCMKCGEPCWVDQTGMRLVIDLGATVVCLDCAGKPDVILLVKESEFNRAVEEAKRHRDARRRMLATN